MKDKASIIYEAVLKLVNQQKNPYKITIAEIADTCGIGKGTVYEYFESKEDIFIKTFNYFIKQVIDDINNIEDQNFKNMFYHFYAQLEKMYLKSNAAYFTAMFGDSNFELSIDNAQIISCIVESLKVSMDAFIRRLMTQGVKEGVVRDEYDPFNLFFGSVGIIASIFVASSPLSFSQQLKESLTADSCYKSFLKLIN